MITDNLSNGCNNAKQKNINDRVKNLEDVINGYDENFNSKNISTQNLEANKANIPTLTSGGITADNVTGGLGTFDGLTVNGAISADKFNITEPILVPGVTTTTADIENLDATSITSQSAVIKNLTVDNLVTAPDSSLEYKNLSVTKVASINKLNLIDPHVTEVLTDHGAATNFDVQNISMDPAGKITRSDNGTNALSFVKDVVIIGGEGNDVNIAGKGRPKWNDLTLATLADIQGGAIKPVYRGIVNTFDELPQTNNTLGDLYIIKSLTIAGDTGIGHAQWNGISWDPSLIYELSQYVNILNDQTIDGKKTFIKPIDGTISNASQLNSEGIASGASLDDYLAEDKINKLYFGNADGTINGMPGEATNAGNFIFIPRKVSDTITIMHLQYALDNKVVTWDKVVETTSTERKVLADWTRLANVVELETKVNNIIDGTTPVTKVAEGTVDAKGNKLATIKDVKTASWVGTKARFDAEKEITDPDNKDYIADGTLINLTDDVNDSLNVASEVRLGDLNPVTSDAVAKFAQMIFDTSAHPLYSTYLQYDAGNEHDPNFLFNNELIKSRWLLVSDPDHEYLYAADMEEAIGELREEQLPNIMGTLMSYDYDSTTKTEFNTGAFHARPLYYRVRGSAGESLMNVNFALFKASDTLVPDNNVASPEYWKTIPNPAYKDPVNGVPVNVRPRSKAVGIWERVE